MTIGRATRTTVINNSAADVVQFRSTDRMN